MDRAGGESALLRIERGQVTEEELAALTAVLGALLARTAHPGQDQGHGGDGGAERGGGPGRGG
ncbi:acyl-CoA carboxylase subunit epsilon, partial [Streptomyces aurantiacus]